MAIKDRNVVLGRSYLFYIFSYSPFIALLIGPLLFLTMLVISVMDQTLIINVNIDSVIDVFFIPSILGLIFITTLVSLLTTAFFWHEINQSDLKTEQKKEWKSLFIKTNVFASSLYFDHKYKNQKYIFQAFFQKSRMKILESINISTP